MADIVLFAIWIVLGLLIGLAAGSIWKSERPFGEVADYVLSLVLTLVVGVVDWYLVPGWFGIEGALKFLIAVTEPPLAALIGLWVLRKVKR